MMKSFIYFFFLLFVCIVTWFKIVLPEHEYTLCIAVNIVLFVKLKESQKLKMKGKLFINVSPLNNGSIWKPFIVVNIAYFW